MTITTKIVTTHLMLAADPSPLLQRREEDFPRSTPKTVKLALGQGHSDR